MNKDELFQRMKNGEITILKYYIEVNEITVSDLAKQSGVDEQTLDDYASGRRGFADIELGKGLRIADILGADVYDLI
ncbi:MAG: helix-turn-helix domain-containing protein [Firmicutes bacterium]|nr:helix-turn-helix domain-containing protein [Bacillota bacterium]